MPGLISTQDGQRLIVVSNRLPVTIKKGEDGQWSFSMSSGGLVSALSGTKKQMEFTWIGWPGGWSFSSSSSCCCCCSVSVSLCLAWDHMHGTLAEDSRRRLGNSSKVDSSMLHILILTTTICFHPLPITFPSLFLSSTPPSTTSNPSSTDCLLVCWAANYYYDIRLCMLQCMHACDSSTSGLDIQ